MSFSIFNIICFFYYLFFSLSITPENIFLTLNIRGLNETNKVQFLKDFLRDQKVDICFLQETHINSPVYVDELGNIFCDFFAYFTVNFDKTKGVGVLIRKNLSHAQ